MTSKTKMHFVTGPIRYIRIFPETKDMGNGGKIDFTEENGRYSLQIVLTEELKAEMIGNGVPEVSLGYNQFKLDQDGNPVYTFKRPHTHKTMIDSNTGTRKEFGPPQVFDMNKAMDAWKESGEGSFKDHIVDWDYENDPTIWNGTIAKVKYSVYQGKKGCVIRLESVAIIELAEKPTQNPEDTDMNDAYF